MQSQGPSTDGRRSPKREEPSHLPNNDSKLNILQFDSQFSNDELTQSSKQEPIEDQVTMGSCYKPPLKNESS